MKNIHILPTDKPSDLYILGKELKLRYVKDLPIDSDITVNQNIYITSDEEIKEGDWHLSFLRDKFEVINYLPNGGYRTECLGKEVCKIVLTTDQDLIDDSVQAIDDECLKWFVKNPSCEFVKIEGYIYKGQYETEYKIIIPKEEQKQHIIDMMKSDEELRLYDEESPGYNHQARLVNDLGKEIKFGNTPNDEKIEDIELEEVRGSSHCQFSVVENKLAIIYRNQLKILQAIKMLNNGKRN